MRKKRGFTLLEIIVAMACMGLLMFTGWSVLDNVMNKGNSAVGNVATQTEAKHVVESLISIVKNATELEILGTTPTIEEMEQSESKYVYSDNGVVHYFDGISDIPIKTNDVSLNELLFSGDAGTDVLKYQVTSKNGKAEYVSDSSIILNNIEDGIDNIVGSGNCIRFKAESNVALIVEFNFLKANNSVDKDIIGYVADGYIEVWVPGAAKIDELRPSVKFFGDKVVVSDTQLAAPEMAVGMDGVDEINNYELEVPIASMNFTKEKYYYVVRNDIVKEYKVVVKKDEDIKVQVRQGNNIVGWQDQSPEARTSDKTIVFDENFKAYVPNSNNTGTYTWYVRGVEAPIKSSGEDWLTVKELEDHNNKGVKNDATKYDSLNPNENEDAMLYIRVEFTPEGATTPYRSEPVFVYPVTRGNLGKEFDDFYFKIATDVWVKSRLIEKGDGGEKYGVNMGKSGEDMALEFMDWYLKNTKKTYDHGSVKLNTKTGADTNTIYTDTWEKNTSYNYGYDKAPKLVRTMYKISFNQNSRKYEIKPTIFVCGDNTTSTAAKGAPKAYDAPYTRTAFSIDVDYFNKKVNTLSGENNKISNIVTDSEDGQVNTYQFSVTYAPGNLESVKINNNEIKLDVKEKAEIQKLSVGVFNDERGNGFRYMTGGNAEPQLPSKGYLKVVNYSDIYTSTYMYTAAYRGLVPYEAGNAYNANFMQEYVLNDNLENRDNDKLESITLTLNTVRQPDTFKSKNTSGNYEIQGKSVNTYVEILRNGKVVEGTLPTPSNTGEINAAYLSSNLFTSNQTASLMIGNTDIYARYDDPLNFYDDTAAYNKKTIRTQPKNPEIVYLAGPGYGAPGYVGVPYNAWYDKMLIGDNLYSANYDGRYTGNVIRTNTTQKQNERTFGSNTMGNIITVGSANDSHENNNSRSTAGENANKSLQNDQYVHYITDMDLRAGYESEAIEVVEAKVISNLKIAGVDVTAVEMKFNKPIRSGYGTELYKIDGKTPVNIDDSITSYLVSNNGKDVAMNTVDDTSRLPVMEPAYQTLNNENFATYISNLNARDIKITDGTTNYEIYRNNNYAPTYAPDKIGDQHFVYKTGENTLVAIVKGTLDSAKTYDIEFERGAVQAMVGGALLINDGQIKPGEPIVADNYAWNAMDPNEKLDVYEKDYVTIKAEEDQVQLVSKGTEYYRADTIYLEDRLKQKVNMNDGFVVTAKFKRKKAFSLYDPQVFNGMGIYSSATDEKGDKDIGYALIMTDKVSTEWGKQDPQYLPNFYVMSIRNHKPVDKDGLSLESTNMTPINEMLGKLYYDRKAGEYYKYEATFKGQTITLKVFDDNDKQLGETVVVTIPDKQYNNLEFDTIDIQSDGRENNVTTYKELTVKLLSQ